MEKDVKAYAMTFVTVILSLIAWNLFIKGFMPTGIRTAVGLG